jgi:hypothetical protein
MNNALFPQRDFDGERRCALAKVYMLLLKLAEEAEKPTSDAHAKDEASVEGGTSVSEQESVN